MASVTSLYRSILKLHQAKLPPPMREMGDKYVKAEFTSHIKGKTTEEQWHQFMQEWRKYREALAGEGGEHVRGDVITQMNAEQQSKMSTLYNEAKVMRKKMIEDALPFDK